MPEKYKPTSEEIAEAENTMKNFGLDERSKEVQEAFGMGEKRKEHEILSEMTEADLHFKRKMIKLVNTFSLSREIEDLLMSNKPGIEVYNNKIVEIQSRGITGEQLLKILDALPASAFGEFLTIDFCGQDTKAFTKRVLNKLFERIPGIKFSCGVPEDYEPVRELLTELGGKEVQEDDMLGDLWRTLWEKYYCTWAEYKKKQEQDK